MKHACVGPGAVGDAVRAKLIARGFKVVNDGDLMQTWPAEDTVDVAVCTIGRLRVAKAGDHTYIVAKKLMESNYLIPRCFIERHAAAMIHDGVRGQIIVLGSNAAVYGNQFAEDYAAGKSALMKYCELRGRELREHGIRLSVLNFGGIEGPFWDKVTDGADPELTKTVMPGARLPLTIDEAAEVVMATILLPPNVCIKNALVVSTLYQ